MPASIVCPECDNVLHPADPEVGEEFLCSDCGSMLEITSEDPLEVQVVYDEDDDWDDEDDEDDELWDEEEEDEDDEEEDGFS